MATVFVPTMLQTLTGGVKQLQIEGASIRQIVNKLDEMFPGMKDRLVEEGQIRSNLAVAIDGEVARMGLLEKVGEHSEVHFVPAIGGGGGRTFHHPIFTPVESRVRVDGSKRRPVQ